MKSRKLILSLFGTALLGMIISACGANAPKVPSEHVPPADTKDLNVATRVIDFASDKGAFDFYASSGYSNGEPFNVTWNGGNVKKEDSNLHLQISPALGAETPYFGGELRSYKFYGYGDYGVRMKPAKVAGTASTFFTYTGEWDSEAKHPSTGETDTRNPDNAEGVHDEIDIEFLGKDTTKVQFNYFTNGRGGNEFMYDLGFDASEEWHDYGFRWEKDRITWFVDEKPVYTATTNIPSHPGRIISNYWCGTEAAAAWMDVYDGKTPGDAVYSWFSATAEGKETHKEPEPVDPGTEIDWSKYNAVAFTGIAGNTETYTYELSEDDTAMEVTYTNVQQNYNNLNVAVPSAAADARALSFEVENKGTEAVAVRGNANAAATHGEHDIYAVNVSGKQDGVPVNTDLEWGGSFFVIEPGQTSLCEIVYSEAVTRLEWMIDSHIAGEQSGDIVIKNLKFDLDGEIQPDTPATKPEATKPANVSDLDAFEFTNIAGNVGDDSTYSYLLSDDAKAMAVTYVVTGGPNYNNINVGAPALAAEARKLSFKVENKGEAAVAVRGNANAATSHGEHNIYAVNVSATQDGAEVYTDLEWGGSSFNIAPGQTSLCEIVYSDQLAKLEWMIDSHIAGDHVGYVVISDLKFDLPQVTRYNVSFNANGGTGEMTTLQVREGEYTLPASTFTAPANKAFDGWKINGEGEIKLPGSNITLAADVSLVAQWKDATLVNKYTVSFNANGGSGEMASVEQNEGSYTLPANAFTAPAGKVFAGWKAGNAGDVLAAGAAYSLYANVELYAQWAIDYTVAPAKPADVAAAGAVALSDIQGNDTYKYTLSDDTKAMAITYSQIGQNYNNLNVAIPAAVSEARTLSFKVENKGEATVAVRGNANASTTHGEHSITAVNVSGKQDGVDVNTDLEWGGTFFSIEAGKTAVCEITYSEAISRLEWMIDSHVAGTQSGYIVISDLEFVMPIVVKHNVSFNANGGTGNMQTVEVVEGEYTLPENTFTAPTDKAFDGWKVNGEGEIKLPGAKINVAADVELVAQWKDSILVNKYTVSFNANGGSGSMQSVEQDEGSYTLPANGFTAPTFYKFVGWKAGNTGDVLAAGATYSLYANVELYAQWEYDYTVAPAQPADSEDANAVALTDIQGSTTTYHYTLSEDNKAIAITYSEISQNYNNLNVAIPSAVADSRTLSFKVENKGANTVAVRGNANAATTHGVNNIYAVNVSGKQDGTAVATDLDWGGTFFSIEAGKTAVCEITYSEAITRLEWMIDSHITGTQSGYIIISDLKFAEPPVGPEPITLNFGSTEEYTATNVNGVSTITYASVSDNTYKNVIAPIADLLDGKVNNISFKFKNNGEATNKIQIGLYASDDESNTNSFVLNVDGLSDWYDDGSHRAQFEIAPGVERTLNLRFDPANNPGKLLIMIDSLWASETSVHTNGSVAISEVEISEVKEEKVITLEFGSTDVYTAVNANGESNITYASVSDNSYLNVVAPIADLLEAGNNNISFKFKNNGEATNKVQFGVYAADDTAYETSLVVNANGLYDYFDTYSNRAQFEIAAGAERTLNIRFDGAGAKLMLMLDSLWASETGVHTNGSITISGVELSTVAAA